MIVHDHVLTDFICNLRCTYCPCEVDLIKRKGDMLYVRSSEYSPAYHESIGTFLERNQEVIRRSKRQKNTPILKVSGGEIFLIPEFMNMLPILADKYAVVQILTNGTLINPTIIEKLKAIPNIHIQVSLDGHTIEMNTHRFRNPRVLLLILNNLTLLSKANIPLEINCVLTTANTGGFFDFVKDIDHRLRECIVYPFPVRSNPELFPHPDQIETFEQAFKENFLSVKHLLPPIQYFHALIEFMKSGKRLKGCYVPHVVLATSGDGQLEACTCGPVKSLGNVLATSVSEAFMRVGKDPCYDSVREPDLSPVCCHDCFTHYDIINLFMEGGISVRELKTMPFFNAPEVIDKLIAIKEELDLSKSEVRR
ncbi:MAG: radical SAM protein [Anaerolineae bacterium]